MNFGVGWGGGNGIGTGIGVGIGILRSKDTTSDGNSESIEVLMRLSGTEIAFCRKGFISMHLLSFCQLK